MNQADALAQLLEEKTELLLLQFTDIMGSIKTVEIPADRFEVALAGEVSFDGSALEGFHRTIESELLLKPDLETLRLSPAVEGETLPPPPASRAGIWILSPWTVARKPAAAS